MRFGINPQIKGTRHFYTSELCQMHLSMSIQQTLIQLPSQSQNKFFRPFVDSNRAGGADHMPVTGNMMSFEGSAILWRALINLISRSLLQKRGTLADPPWPKTFSGAATYLYIVDMNAYKKIRLHYFKKTSAPRSGQLQSRNSNETNTSKFESTIHDFFWNEQIKIHQKHRERMFADGLESHFLIQVLYV